MNITLKMFTEVFAVAGQLFWATLGGGFARVFEGNVADEHAAEFANCCADRNEIPRTAHDACTH